MKSLVLSFLCFLTFPHFLLQAGTPVTALPVTEPNETGPTTYAEWVDGAEKPIAHTDNKGLVKAPNYLWSAGAAIEGKQLIFGDSKTPGVRYLRIGFDKPVPVGSILVHGGGRVSVLKPGATLPGDLKDD